MNKSSVTRDLLIFSHLTGLSWHLQNMKQLGCIRLQTVSICHLKITEARFML